MPSTSHKSDATWSWGRLLLMHRYLLLMLLVVHC
jgi:hypothetical protein